MTIPPPDSTTAPTKHAMEPHPPLDGFAVEEFKARRDALRAACPDGLILVRGATEPEFMLGNAGLYRQNSHFFYLTGVDTAGAYLVLLPEGLPPAAGLRDLSPDVREILFLPARNPVGETWTGPKLGPGEETAKATGVARVLDAGNLWNALVGWMRRNPLLYTITPYGDHAETTREYTLMQEIRHRIPTVQFRDAALALGQLRVVKSKAETTRMEQAIAVTIEGQRAAMQAIAAGAGRWEYEVEAAIFAAFRSRGAVPGFPAIVGSGVRSTVLHYEENHAQMQAGELVVVDIGARLGHYSGDITRTFPVGGKFSPRQREIYTLVLEAHRHCVASYVPGSDTVETIKERCKKFLKDSGLRAKDLNGNEQTMDTFLPHGISHHLGLDVHDVGDIHLPLSPGNVITVEPGVYIPSENIGVRLENDYLVTATGLERLGPTLDMEPDAVEAAMAR